MGKYRTRELTQRVRYALLAGVAGAFLIPQVAAAAPTGGEVVFGGATIPPTSSDMNITSSNPNNVITWRDYSIAQGERVRYDNGAKTNNYLNIVTGANTSNINGTIEGGKDVYIVNPNGVIFGKTASVNVGNLYVSTQETSTVGAEAFETSGTAPLSTTAVGKADVVNMGSITANKVEVYGRSIRILDAANVHATTSPVILHIDEETNGGYAHIGYQSGSVPSTSDYEIHKKFTPPPPSPSSPPLPPTTVVAAATAADNYYQLVSTPTEFQNIKNGLTKNYMLANDIDFYDSTTGTKKSITPIGGNSSSAFTGKFDGNFYKIKNFSVGGAGMVDAALFGRTNAARIDNVGVTDAVVTGEVTGLQDRFAGGIVAHATGTTLNNVYVTNTKVTGEDGYHGGVVGYTKNTHIGSSYSKATVGDGGGVIGFSDIGTVVEDTYSDTKKVSGSLGTEFIYIIDPSGGTTVKNSYSVGTYFTTNETALTTEAVNTYKIDPGTGKASLVGPTPNPSVEAHTIDTYAAWGNAINNTGAPGAKWRIYEGRTLPLLTAFMDGTATATYDTRYFNANGTLNAESANTAKSNKGADIETTYNSQYVKIVGKDGSGADVVGGKSNVVTYAGAMQYNADGTPNLDHIYDYVSAGTNDFDKTNGIRNAGTKAILWSDQDGPNLRGVNVTVKQRVVSLDNGTIKPDRMYNGKSDVTDAFIHAVTNGSIKSSGFTKEDIEAHSVNLNYTAGNFKAQVYNLAYENASGVTIAAGTHADKNVGVDKPVKFTGSIDFSGDDAANYKFDNASLSNITGKVTITKAPLYLKINKSTANAKIYDGTDAVLDAEMKQTGTTRPNITLNKDNYAPASTVTSPTHHKGEIMLDDGDNPDVVDLTQVTDPTYTDTTGAKQIHVGDHSLQYKNVGLRGADAGNYDLYLPPIPAVGNGNKVVGNTVYLDGKIIAREITRDSFKVYDSATNAEVTAEKVYDGNATYTPGGSVYLSTNAPASGNIGIVTRDQGHITFALTGGKGTFKDATGANSTKNVAEARKIAYNVTGVADTHTDADGIGHKLEDYYVLDADGVTKHSLSNAFDATGQGRITPKALTATVVNNHITKVYDAKQNQTDGNRNDIIGDALVTLSGFVSGETRTNTSTAMYASPNVAWDNTTNAPTSQTVTYTAKFDRGTGAEADNYTLDPTAHTTTVTNSASVSGSYTGTITPRDLKLTFGDVTKVYDGTADNATKNVTALDDGLSGAVTTADGTTADGTTAAGISAAALSSVTSSYGDFSGTTFNANRNAGNRVVEYVGLAGALGTNHNYAIADKQYGKGTITRRRIDPSGFQVRKAGGAIANASKVYDGTDLSDLPQGASLVTPTATSGDTGIVAHDEGKITFKLKDGTHGYFSRDADGNNRTSHVSEAQHVAYDIVAHTSDDTNNPLSNYTFGSAAAEAAGTLRNLEKITNANPAHVTASGTITPAALHAQTHSIEKVYDGLATHTDGNRAAVADKDTIITFTGWVTHNDITEKRTNNSSAVYQAGHSVGAKDVAYDMDGITTKDVTYTAALTGNYANDYEIVDITGAGAATTGVTTTVADAGKITPRALKIVMDDVSKTYDGNAKNTTVSVKEITDTIGSAVIDDILSDDNVTALDLTNQYTAKMTAAPDNYKSTYGRGNTDAKFVENVNASNGTPHDVQYTNMREAFRTRFGSTSAGNYSVEKNVYGKGTINRRNIDPNNFRVVDDHNVPSHATKEYDGTTTYNVPTGWKLDPPSGPSTGVITGDDVTFYLTSDGAQFTTAAHNPTPNAYDADKVMYNVAASGDHEKIKNYTLGGRKLEDGKAKVYGEGKITRRVLSLGLVNNTDINKVYDGQTGVVDTDTKHWKALTKTDAKGNVEYTTGSKELVNDGSSFRIVANYRNSANTANDKNVAYNSATPREVIAKAIEYNIQIAGTGDARNYAFANGTSTPTNAESGLKLSATGKITPKDLSGAFEKVTKVYDGTTNVPVADVKFKKGADGVIVGDNITFTHNEAFRSANVNGDGSTQVIDGTAQKNWVNYSNLTLSGTDAGNYTLASTAVGLGEITPLELNPSTVTLVTTQAEKVYDGGVKVKKAGSDAISAIKNYITDATVTVGGSTVSVLPDLELQSAEYDTKNVVGGAQPRVTYHMKYKGTSGNFTLAPGAATFDGKGKGVITPKDVTATIKGPLTKVYDATANTIGAAKNATTGAAVVTADDLVKFVGLVAGDDATNATTATFDNKNVGTNKTVTYDIKLDTASAGNYNIKYNGSAINAPITQTGNTITKRKVNVTFGEQHKPYDGLSKNTSIDASVSDADAAVLNRDVTGLAVADKLTNLTATGATPNIVSNYGKRTGTGFTPDANAGTNKDVQYAGLSAAMNTSLGGNAGNYEFDTDGYGKGYIERATINVNDSSFTFTATDAKKVYDGTNKVLWKDSSSGIYYGDNSHVKNYISTIGVTLNGHWVDLSGSVVMDLTGTKYSSPNATNGTPDTVTYKFRLNTNNIIVNGGTNEFTKTAQGTIDRRVLKLDLAQDSAIDKIYDANEKLIDTSTRHYDKFIDDDANGNVIYAAGIANDNKLVRTSNGAAVNDGAKMTITANYVDNLTNRAADKNVARVGGNVTAKDIAYNVKIDAANGGKNYTLDHNGTTANAEDGLKMNASGTISPRKITLAFADVPPRSYNTLTENTVKTVNAVNVDNRDGHGKTALDEDVINTATFDMTNVASDYGKGNTDETFVANPDVVLNSAGAVIPRGKDVQYRNLAGTLAGQTYAGNYEIADTAYGKGTITKARVDARTDFDFRTSAFAEKEYDGNRDIKWQGDTGKIENYFVTAPGTQGSRVKIDGVWRDITSSDIKVDAAHSKYHNKNVGAYLTDLSTGKQYNAQVDYRIKISTQNFDVDHLSDGFIPFDNQPAIITPRDITPYFDKTHIIKEYDGTANLSTANINAINKTKQLSILVPGDDVTLDVDGVYMNTARTQNEKNASADTEAIAKARTDADAGLSVKYNLSLDGTDKGNYGFKNNTGGYDMNTVVYGTGDIYKKTLTVKVGSQEKYYDDTRQVGRNVGGPAVFIEHPDAATIDLSEGVVGTEHVAFDQTAADKINGLYSDPNVGSAKNISYTGFENALANYVARNPNSDARNYRVDDKASGKGAIKARPIDANDIVNVLQFKEASKVYDGTDVIKYNGSSASADLINYLDSAKININGKEVDLKTDLRIDDKKENTHYADKDAHGEDLQNNLTYHLNYVGNNFTVTGSIDKTNAKGKILRKEITATVNGPLTKEYDATRAVYDAADSSIKTFHKSDLSRQNQVDRPDELVTIHGLVAGDGATNATTAHYGESAPSDDDKNVGTDKTVTYDVKIDPANADNYHISSATITTRGNEITPRRLMMKFRNVDKIYDGTAENDDVRAYTDTADDRKVLERDHITFNADDNVDGLTDVDSRYGDVTNGVFTDNPNAGTHKVRYQNISSAMNALLGNAGANYKIADEVLGDGTINKATVGRNSFDFVFDRADKEYDGTAVVYGKNHSTDLVTNLNTDETQPTHSKVTWQDKNGHTLTRTLRNNDVKAITGEYRDGKNALVHVSTDPNNPNPVGYHLVMNADNFAFNDTGMYDVSGAGQITKRKLIAAPLNYLTKEYDGTTAIVVHDAAGNLITAGGDNLVKFHHYSGTSTKPDDGEDTVFYGVDARTVSNGTTADYAAVDPTKYADKDVEWKDNVWKQGRGVVGDKNVNYWFAIKGTGANNYEIVDANGNAVNLAIPYVGKGKITPKEIVLKADPQERWINEGLPTSYTGTPQGTNLSHNEVPEIVPSDAPLPGTITYSSPNARLRVGYYAVEGTYHAPNGADGDSVSWNYRFIQDPANKTALYIGPYIPDYEYYKAMTQVSKMTPDEYAYENASLDRTNQYSRKPTAQVDPVPPAINVVKDGVDIRQNDINVLDDTVYTIVDEVFG